MPEIHSSTVNYATRLTDRQALDLNNFIYPYGQNINRIIGADEFQHDLEKIASSDQNVTNSAEDDLV